MPADTNPHGDIFGGWILAQMDLAGGTHALFVAGGRVATVAVTGMKFHKPVYVGDEVSCYCRTVRIGNTSIVVDVDAWVRRRHSHEEEQVTEGQFTFVAVDDAGQPRAVSDSSRAHLDGVDDAPAD
ncbi:MAG: acyl-CoA thioesterase [Gammaproteobacteria bacterium]|nr:MAG: acyl-CoA thioesterase [Gammaproteobacteria bacterium]PIE36285.1 MAG: acyl-CoA thioesterase [Gammaproteobacteria bacterium]